MKLKSSLMSDK